MITFQHVLINVCLNVRILSGMVLALSHKHLVRGEVHSLNQNKNNLFVKMELYHKWHNSW